MNYIEGFLGKKAEDLSYVDIENFFVNNQNESDILEFKSYFDQGARNHTEKENGILRTVCGMLNSAGGLVIWGAPIGVIVQGQKEKLFQGALSPLTQKIEKDQFISRVTGSITPAPSGVRLYEFESRGNFIYLIEIDTSTYTPHQFKNTYLMRLDGQTMPAPHHYVEAMFRKITYPKIEGYIKFKELNEMKDGTIAIHFGIVIINQTKLHNEYDIYLRVITNCFFHAKESYTQGQTLGMGRHELSIANLKSVLYYQEPVTRYMTVYLDLEILRKNNNLATFHIIFSGKKSPLKQSVYTLDLTNIYGDLNDKIADRQLNKYNHELSPKDLTEEQKINELLKSM